MAYLIDQLFGWLLIVAILCALAGWAYHLLRTGARELRLREDRATLLRQLTDISLEGVPTEAGPITLGAEREAETLRTRADIAQARVTELERINASLRDQRERDLARIAELEARPEPATLLVDEEPALLPAPDDGLTSPERWRLRYFEARAKHLEETRPEAGPAEPAIDPAAFAAVTKERDELREIREKAWARVAAASEEIVTLRARVGELEEQARAAPDIDPAPLLDDNTRLGWEVRYLRARVAYLEGQERAAAPVAAVAAAPAPSPEDEENARRQAWRMRYLEARVAHLSATPAETPAPVVDVAPFEARIVDLETALAAASQRAAEAEQRAAAVAGRIDPAEARARDAEQRAAALEARLRETGAEANEAAGLRARVAELEALLDSATAPAASVDAEEHKRLKWQIRYLHARIRHLEDARDAAATAIAPAPRAPAAQPVYTPTQPPVAEPDDAPLVPMGAEVRPIALAAPRMGAPDDLRLIEGIGPKLESTLNSLGVYHFDQIAAWTPANIAWVDQYLRFRGRISRERWVEQARVLAESVDGYAMEDDAV